ncbi:putative baseplate assembly protein [Paenibacillus soyae]|uniref:Baseplate assembly protein n=1 Tax=Paenibacillus soyae TaxID=2969249 RepID=A0A9X2S8I4_9BACL|nr:putative baseplate assembly protein [Paenibacillus soyae]MCR2802448.1 putative baseplate assembly protein [Paenibacillus soyae]
MLPRLPLDDRTYAEIVQQSRKIIPKRMPEWTDENAHDPGMTMLEMLAWLTEMQRYYISRVPDRNKRKFLDLLGVAPRDTESARTLVQFSGVTEAIHIPRGTKLMAEDQMFETERSIRLHPLALDRIICRTEREANDVTAWSDHLHVAFQPFGTDAKRGARLYISFDRELEPGELATLTFKLLKHDESLRDVYDAAEEGELASLIPSARLSWKAYCWDEQAAKASWMPLQVVRDETAHFSTSGSFAFRIGAPMRSVVVHPAADKPRYWISCTIEEGGYELPPRISGLMLHTVMASQRDTLCEYMEYETTGEPGQSFVLDTYLAMHGEMRVQIGGGEQGWTELPLGQFEVERRPGGDGVSVKLASVPDDPPLAPGTRVRLIASVPGFYRYSAIGSGNGLPNQAVEAYDLACRKKTALGLQVARRERDGTLRWEDWSAVEDFDRSGPYDRHYVYMPEKRVILFGNGEKGAIPEASPDANIGLIACELGGGARGNVKPGLIREWASKAGRTASVAVSNPFYAHGGSEAETLQETLLRAQMELKQTFRAVTEEDYEILAKETPGVEVARVKAIPLYKPGLSDYPREKAHGQISVVVVPYGHTETPSPSPGFLRTVQHHLDSRRLIATELHVIPPLYVRITVHAAIVVEPQYADDSRKLAELLKELLRPLGGRDGREGWEFGRTVYKGDIYNALTKASGVVFVQDLWLDADGAQAKKTAGGDIQLPPHGLVYSGEHEIELISRTRL